MTSVKLINHSSSTADWNEYIIRLWDDYGKYIKSHRFSIDKDDHSWREFDADEEIKLKQLKTY